MKKLKIAILGSNFIRIPPRPKDLPSRGSGATEEIIANITNKLVERGHKVVLFASGDSKTKAKLISLTKRSTSKDPKIGFIRNLYDYKGENVSTSKFHEPYELLLISKAYQMAKEFDIIHSHFDTLSAFFAPFVKIPTVSTLHSPLEKEKKEILSHFKNTQYYVSISNSQRKSLPDLNYAATVYHGLYTKNISFNEKANGDYLVFSGRIHPNKGTKEAISVAKKTNSKILIMGNHGNDEYWKKEIEPEIDKKQIIYKGFLDKKEMYQTIREAKALVMPILWEEPFGLTMIEALACGTPVIAFKRGSVPEIIKDGKTGFIVENEKQMINAVLKISQIKRKECRKEAEEKFNIEKMIDNYEKVYYNILKNA